MENNNTPSGDAAPRVDANAAMNATADAAKSAFNEAKSGVETLKTIPTSAEFRGFDFMRMFEGRVGRAHFIYFVLAAIIGNLVLGMLPLIGVVVGLALMVIGVGVSVRRLHDFNCTGWYVLVPLVAQLILIPFGLGTMLGGGMMYGMGYGGGMMFMGGILSMILSGLVPLVFILYLAFKQGDATPNKYGAVPNPNRPFIHSILNM